MIKLLFFRFLKKVVHKLVRSKCATLATKIICTLKGKKVFPFKQTTSYRLTIASDARVMTLPEPSQRFSFPGCFHSYTRFSMSFLMAFLMRSISSSSESPWSSPFS